MGNHLLHCVRHEWTHHLRKVSRHWLSHSVCPSLCGWYDELIASWVSLSLNNSCHTWLVKIRSLSEIIVFGRPWSLYIFAKYNCATCRAVKGWERGMKCPYLVNLSITTSMVLNQLDCGRPSMKSRLTTAHGWDGIANGCRRPGDLMCSTFACWQIVQALT